MLPLLIRYVQAGTTYEVRGPADDLAHACYSTTALALTGADVVHALVDCVEDDSPYPRYWHRMRWYRVECPSDSRCDALLGVDDASCNAYVLFDGYFNYVTHFPPKRYGREGRVLTEKQRLLVLAAWTPDSPRAGYELPEFQQLSEDEETTT